MDEFPKIKKETSMGDSIALIAFVAPWVTGVVLAKGAVETILAILIPMYSWYLTAEYFINSSKCL